jgi:putative thioredoxin
VIDVKSESCGGDSEAAAMAQAKEAMQAAKDETESWLFELQDYGQWRTHVMEESIPVILDCYAEWCAPCKKLLPILMEKVKAEEGKLKLVKLNIDDLPKLSSGLNIRSVPSVFLIYKGNVVDMLKGIPEDQELDNFFQTALMLNKMQTDEKVMADVIG